MRNIVASPMRLLNKLWVRLTIAYTIATIGVLAVIFVGLHIGFSVRVQRYLERRYAQLTDLWQRQLELYYEQHAGWEGIDELLGDDPTLELVGVRLVDANGEVVYSAGEQGPPPSGTSEREIVVNDRVVGYLWIGRPTARWSGAPERALLRALRDLLIAAALLAAGGGLVVAGVLTHSLTRPLQRLVGAVQAVAAGDLEQRVEETGSEEVVHLTRAFNEMTTALHKAARWRQQTMADIAHELRTPLSVIQGNLRAILDDVYPLEKAEIARLYDETRLLSRLVDDLRQLAQAEAGQLTLYKRPTDLAALCRAAVVNLGPAVETKGIALSLNVSEPLPIVQADPERLTQVLRNLLSNALRYTPPGGRIEVTAQVVQGHPRVSVTDSGPGIAPEHLERIFDRLWRASPSRSRQDGGSGLGLAIAKSLVEAHGGRIWAESAPGEGATFIFELPPESDDQAIGLPTVDH